MSLLLLPASAGTSRIEQQNARLRAWLLFAPVLLWLVLFVLVPTINLVVMSFCGRDALGRIVYDFTWQNYARALSPIYFKVLFNSLLYAALTTIICIVLAFPAAYYIARAPVRIRYLLLTLIIIPFWANFLLRTYSWIGILSTDGVLNGLLIEAGLIRSPVELLYTPFSVVLGLVYNFLPFMILPIYVAVEKLPNELVEASLDLGARPIQVFRHVVLPLTKSGIVAGILLVFVPAVAMFAIANLMGGGSVPTLGDVIQKQFTSGRNPAFGAALGTILLALFLIAFWIFQPKAPPHGQRA